MHLAQYRRFLGVGAVVGLITLGCREALGRALPADDALYYSLSVAGAYAIGILLSFMINRSYTFGRRGGGDWSRLPRFVLVALTGLLSTWLLAIAFRYGLPLDRLIGPLAPPGAFALATLCSSAITYPLTAVLVFPRTGAREGDAAEGLRRRRRRGFDPTAA